MRSFSGYMGSTVVHIGILGVAALCAMMAPSEPDVVRPGVVTVYPGDPSPGDSGAGPAASLTPVSPAGNASRPNSGFTRVTPVSANKILAAIAAREAEEARLRPPVKSSVDRTPPSPPVAPATPGRVAIPAPRPGSTPAPAPVVLKPVTVGGGEPGSASGAGGLIPVVAPGGIGSGVLSGSGAGASGIDREAFSLFAAGVRDELGRVYIPLFREKGGELSIENDSAEVRLMVSASGRVTVDGWAREPADAGFSRLIREAVESMRPLASPPGGRALRIVIPICGRVE